MNSITAQMDLARAIEEIANRKDGQLPNLSSSLDRASQNETTAPVQASYADDVTEITACIRTPKNSENSEPGIDVANCAARAWSESTSRIS